LLGNETGSLPEGFTSPKIMLARLHCQSGVKNEYTMQMDHTHALPASCPGISWKRIAGAASFQVMKQAPGHQATTTVFGCAATIAFTRVFCQSGSERSVCKDQRCKSPRMTYNFLLTRSDPSDEVVATTTTARSTDAAKAACTNNGAPR
jgi:hypothetical protein